jgi:hypothetical protein
MIFLFTTASYLLYNWFMKSKTPIKTPILIGAESNTAEAGSDPKQVQYPAFGCGTQGEFHDDLPQLPDRMQAQGLRPQG